MKTISPALLRVFYIVNYGEDIKKNEISYKVRPTTDNEPEEAVGCKVAIDLYVKGEKAETHYYNKSDSEAVEEFIREVSEDVPAVLVDAKDYVKLLAEAASSAGLLPN